MGGGGSGSDAAVSGDLVPSALRMAGRRGGGAAGRGS